MIAPAAGTIEEAIDMLKDGAAFEGHEWIKEAQQKALNSAVPNASSDFQSGYELGIQTARVLLLGMPAAIINRVSI